MCAADGEVTLLLRAMKSGDGAAAEKLLPLVYTELAPAGPVVYAARARRSHPAADGSH